jgi:hypothetical protein
VRVCVLHQLWCTALSGPHEQQHPRCFSPADLPSAPHLFPAAPAAKPTASGHPSSPAVSSATATAAGAGAAAAAGAGSLQVTLRRGLAEVASLYKGVVSAATGAGVIIGAYFAFYSTSKRYLRSHTDMPDGEAASLCHASYHLAVPLTSHQMRTLAYPHSSPMQSKPEPGAAPAACSDQQLPAFHNTLNVVALLQHAATTAAAQPPCQAPRCLPAPEPRAPRHLSAAPRHNAASAATTGQVAFVSGAVAAVGSSVVKVPIAVCIRSVQAGVYPNVVVAARSIMRAAGPQGLFTVGGIPQLGTGQGRGGGDGVCTAGLSWVVHCQRWGVGQDTEHDTRP